jgi:hypothetical protein
MATQVQIPSFDSLPLRKEEPPLSAWGMWKETPELGALNHLTDEVVLRAAQEEIKTGQRVGMKQVFVYIPYGATHANA